MPRLWTFQRDVIHPILESGTRYVPAWEFTPENFRPAYEWMTARMYAALGLNTAAPPVWCWHSCGRLGRGPTVGTAELLLSEWDIAQGMVTIELEAPAELVLPSSYWIWNEFLGYVLENKLLPADDGDFRAYVTKDGLPVGYRDSTDMFADPLFKCDDDDIQAVIPYIDPNWIVSMQPLTTADRDWDEPV
jgi:hypothetical protein